MGCLLKTTLHLVIFTLLVAVLSYALGASGYLRSKPTPVYELEQAELPPGLGTQDAESCVAPTDEERRLFTAAVDVLAFPSEQSRFLSTGAHKFLAGPFYRGYGPGSKRVCEPREEYERAARLINNSDHLRRGRLVEYSLKLIAKLPDPAEDLVALVAASAFNESPQQSEIFVNSLRDIRPMARSTLATLGKRAQPYAARAFTLITIDDSMGTGAAQIAVAGGHPEAIEVVERLMTEQLTHLPEGLPIPWKVRNHLYEMAYALSLGGEDAKQHVTPLIMLMGRKVESWAPPYGMIELPPRRMCQVLANIRGVSRDSLEFGYCTETEKPLEQ